MFPPIYQYLSSSAAVVAIAGDKLYLNVAPQGTNEPYVVWGISGGIPQNYLGENPGIDQISIDINCFARSPSVVQNLAEAVRDELQQWSQSQSAPVSDWEFETKLHVVMLTFSFWRNRA